MLFLKPDVKEELFVYSHSADGSETSCEHRVVAREVWFALGAACMYLKKEFGAEVVVTSLLDGSHNPGSLHPKGFAADIRIRMLALADQQQFFQEFKSLLYDMGFDVVLEHEGSTPATTGAHIHVEFQPKDGRMFIRRTE